MSAMLTQSGVFKKFVDTVTTYGTNRMYRLVLEIQIFSPKKSFLLEYETHQIRELLLQARSPQFDSLKISLDWI